VDAARVNVFCNGFPKSGTHALQKAVRSIGVPADVNHRTYAEGLPEGTTHNVFIKRDPRNVVVSWLRWGQQQVTPGSFLAAFRKFQDGPLVNEMAQFEPWLAEAHVVRFEDLIANDSALRGIAHWIGVPYIEGAWEGLPNHTMTWNDEPSDYRPLWPQVMTAWYAEGGGELLSRWGY